MQRYVILSRRMQLCMLVGSSYYGTFGPQSTKWKILRAFAKLMVRCRFAKSVLAYRLAHGAGLTALHYAARRGDVEIVTCFWRLVRIRTSRTRWAWTRLTLPKSSVLFRVSCGYWIKAKIIEQEGWVFYFFVWVVLCVCIYIDRCSVGVRAKIII